MIWSQLHHYYRGLCIHRHILSYLNQHAVPKTQDAGQDQTSFPAKASSRLLSMTSPHMGYRQAILWMHETDCQTPDTFGRLHRFRPPGIRHTRNTRELHPNATGHSGHSRCMDDCLLPYPVPNRQEPLYKPAATAFSLGVQPPEAAVCQVQFFTGLTCLASRALCPHPTPCRQLAQHRLALTQPDIAVRPGASPFCRLSGLTMRFPVSQATLIQVLDAADHPAVSIASPLLHSRIPVQGYGTYTIFTLTQSFYMLSRDRKEALCPL